MKFLGFLKKFDLALILPAFFLTFFGILSVYSSSLSSRDFLNFKKQIIFFAISIIFVVFLSFLDLRFLRTNSYFVLSLYLLSIIALFLVLCFGTEMRGVKGWFKIGSFFVDPVSFSVIILIIILSKYFSTRHIELQRFRIILFSALYMIVPVGLILLQPDLGSSLCLVLAWLGIVIFSGIKMRHFLVLTLIFLIIFTLGWRFFLRDYQKQRILAFLNPKIDKGGISWSVNQSKIAIGSGGIWGKGIGKGSQTQYGFLPEPQTDFIFSAIAEETGFFGVFCLLAVFLFLFSRIIKVAFLAKNNLTRLFAVGFSFLILSQSFINIGMCLGLFPIVGIPLPFVSYGGSQLLAFYCGLGILLSLEKT